MVSAQAQFPVRIDVGEDTWQEDKNERIYESAFNNFRYFLRYFWTYIFTVCPDVGARFLRFRYCQLKKVTWRKKSTWDYIEPFFRACQLHTVGRSTGDKKRQFSSQLLIKSIGSHRTLFSDPLLSAGHAQRSVKLLARNGSRDGSQDGGPSYSLFMCGRPLFFLIVYRINCNEMENKIIYEVIERRIIEGTGMDF